MRVLHVPSAQHLPRCDSHLPPLCYMRRPQNSDRAATVATTIPNEPCLTKSCGVVDSVRSGSSNIASGEERSAFGANLRRLRAAAGLTQEELAERAGLTAAGVSALERGHRRRPHPHTVRALARALGVASSERDALLAATRHSDPDA